jgi:hypothetical protein
MSESYPEHIFIMEFFHLSKLGTIDVSSTPAEKCYFGGLTMFKLNGMLVSINR